MESDVRPEINNNLWYSEVVLCQKILKKICKKHGLCTFRLRDKNRFKCLKCSSEAVCKRRKKVKLLLINQFGGKCIKCGYNKCIGALEFHHIDPSTKKFGLSAKGLTRSFSESQKEAQKCILLCANCRREETWK